MPAHLYRVPQPTILSSKQRTQIQLLQKGGGGREKATARTRVVREERRGKGKGGNRFLARQQLIPHYSNSLMRLRLYPLSQKSICKKRGKPLSRTLLSQGWQNCGPDKQLDKRTRGRRKGGRQRLKEVPQLGVWGGEWGWRGGRGRGKREKAGFCMSTGVLVGGRQLHYNLHEWRRQSIGVWNQPNNTAS